MKYGPIVAKRFKRQYFKKRTGWDTYEFWGTQPEQIHTILLELTTKKSIEYLIGSSWTRYLPRSSK